MCRRLRSDRGSRESGFSLVETTVALALMSVILLSGLSLLTLQPRIQERTRAGEEALRAVEAALETLRAEELPLEAGVLVPGVDYPVINPARELRLTLEVKALTVPGLYELKIVATYLTWGRTASREITTMAWRP